MATNGLGRRLDALEQIRADAWVREMLGIIAEEAQQGRLDPESTAVLLSSERARLERWYPIKVGLELAGTPEREILCTMGAFWDMSEDQITEALRAAS